MGRGYVKLHREAMDHEVFQDEWLWKLFCWCMMKANFKPATFRGKRIARGSFATGRLAAAEELQTNPSRVYRGLTKLAEMGCISLNANSNWTTVTVCNYGTYNSGEDKSEQQVSASVNNKRTASERLSEQQVNTIEETKKPRNQSFNHAASERPNGQFVVWGGIRDRLSKNRVTNFLQAVRDAQECGCTEEYATALLDYAEANGKKPGEIVWRFQRANPNMPVDHGWPAKGERAAEKERLAITAAERKRREKAISDADQIIIAGRKAQLTNEQIEAKLSAAGLEWPK